MPNFCYESYELSSNMDGYGSSSWMGEECYVRKEELEFCFWEEILKENEVEFYFLESEDELEFFFGGDFGISDSEEELLLSLTCTTISFPQLKNKDLISSQIMLSAYLASQRFGKLDLHLAIVVIISRHLRSDEMTIYAFWDGDDFIDGFVGRH